ncbi:ABC transporter permease [Alloacidobacterium dinghuense]|uniref:ABC transporter permease n=1 Tax=Alloacidobacterium dinghuense TaxID=2763107 RepID=A0A7G8BCH9_9BACT|nr:ABC transporter permease [Alloacidobacterium dinghuense]QNI30249.1 ABC transporter permease [Alloacidobacterium dinghuense]
MTSLLNDLRYSFRQLRKTPGFTLVCVLTLALGIGANTAVFSVMNSVLLKSLPVADPQHVVYLRTSHAPHRTGTIDSQETFPYSVYDALRHQTQVLTDLMAYVPLSTAKVAVRYGMQPEEAEGDMVSGNYFSGLGVQLVRGHGFTEQDEASHAPIAVISYNYWTSRFSRNPDVLGKALYVNSIPVTIVGIAAEGFEGTEAGGSTDFWIPLQSREELNAWGNPPEDGKTYITNPTWWCMRLLGRLAPGVTKEQAAAQLQSVFQSAAYIGLGNPEPGEKRPVLSFDDASNFPGYDNMYGKLLKMLMAMVGFVLLIALSNIVMLLLARNATRQREFSLRLALGAGRKELFRQLLTESLLLVAMGGGLAWLFAMAATKALGSWAQIESTLAPDQTVLFFTLTVLILTAFLFGLAPLRAALSSGPELVLKTSSATSNTDAGKTRTGKIVVALQMALCLVLLVGGGLLVSTLRNLQDIPLGMRVDGLVVFGIKPNTHSTAEAITFYQTLTNKLRALPGVESVTIMEERLGSWWSDNFSMTVDGKLPDVPDSSKTVRNNVVGSDFFHTLGVPILEGRDFADSDTAASPPVAIINELFAQRFLPNQNPLGHRIGTNDGKFQFTVVGVVKNHKYRSIDEEPIPMAWVPYTQGPPVGKMHVELRVKGEPLAILPSVRKVIQEQDPNLPLIEPITQRAQYETTISQQLLFARLAGFFGLLAVVLVATGLYGTLAYRVNNRTVEIGVRMAVGAGRGQVVWMVLRDSLILTAVGIGVGIPLAMLASRALTSALYGVKPFDASIYIFAILGVSVVAIAASMIPARRAASIDPLTALRTE